MCRQLRGVENAKPPGIFLRGYCEGIAVERARPVLYFDRDRFTKDNLDSSEQKSKRRRTHRPDALDRKNAFGLQYLRSTCSRNYLFRKNPSYTTSVAQKYKCNFR